MTYHLGIDIGIASAGFAAARPDEKHILLAGARIFDSAEHPKTGASLAAPRREKRGLRRVTYRRAQRKSHIRRVFVEQGICTLDAIKQMLETKTNPDAVWGWRVAGLERQLQPYQWAKVLYHIASHRGFQSNRKGEEPNDTEGKKALSGAKALEEAMLKANAPTIGAYLATLPKKRNGDGEYSRLVTRNLLRDEIEQLFAAQRKLGNLYASEAFEAKYAEVAFTQRPLKSSVDLVGDCTFEEQEKRAPKYAYTAELFVLWTRLNNMRIKDTKTERALTPDEKQRIIEQVHKTKETKYKRLRTLLDMSDEQYFNISYRKIKDTENTFEAIRKRTEDGIFCKLEGYHKLKDCLHTGSDNDWYAFCVQKRDVLDECARILSFYPDENERRELLAPLPLTGGQIEELLNVTSFAKTVDLSVKAITKILPHMQQGMRYDEACLAAGYHHSKKATQGLAFVPPFKDLRNPVVNRSLAQTRKVINAIIRQHGMPDRIIVELSREMGKPFDERKKLEREQKKNEDLRDASRKAIAEIFGVLPENIRSEQILKHRLWTEQGGFCPYSGEYMDAHILREGNATQIDHIIPYSLSFDDSYMNKVLVLTDENQNKQNRTAYEYLSSKDRIPAITAFIATHKLPKKKAERLLMETFDESGWKNRAINDTRYIARTLKNHLEQSLPCKVQVCNGMLTANLRRMWGFPEKSRNTDRHHAIDAIVLTCTTQAMVQQCANESIRQKKRKPISKPWESFRDDALNIVNHPDFFVSRMPVCKVTGAAHEDTIRSIRDDGKGNRVIVQRTKLASLNLAKLENLVDKERNHRLYNILSERLEAHKDDPKKAFAEPVYMPCKEGKQAPQIHAVNLVTSEKSGVEVNQGLASNGDMVRVDVFCNNKKYFLIPIYAHQFADDVLPQRAIVANKPEEEWELMDAADFIFSLHKNELVWVKSKKEEYLGYYVGTDRANAQITLKAHDNDPKFGKDGQQRIGVKTLLAFEKYTVDVLGTISPAIGTGGIREKRRGVAHSGDSECSEDFA
jgi:CRISPR-associated endonuclease Csn1